MYSFLVRRLESFGQLSFDDVTSLGRLGLGKPRRARPRQQIVHEGDERRNALYLISGWLCRYKQLEDGRYQIISFVLPGDLCYSYDPFDTGMNHSLRTIDDAIILDIDSNRFEDVFLSNSPLARAFRAYNSVEAAILRERVLSLGQRTAKERCAHLICELFWRLRAIGLTADNSFQFPITQEEVANTIGTSTVHANRVLQSLRCSGLIDWIGKKQLRINNLKELEAVALFSPRFLGLENSSGRREDSANQGTGSLSFDQLLHRQAMFDESRKQASRFS
jgi:CRP-like cAMP-binding protein